MKHQEETFDEREFVQEVAERIRAVYISERRLVISANTGRESSYEPGPHWDGRGSKRKSIWLHVAKFVIKHQLDPEHHVRSQFATRSQRDVPMPNQLSSAAALARSQDKSEDMTADFAALLATQQAVCESKLVSRYEVSEETPRQIWMHILLNETLPLSALFRYCAAAKKHKELDLTFVMTRYRKGAAVQYVRSREAYDSTWGDWIPKKFKSEALEIYHALGRS